MSKVIGIDLGTTNSVVAVMEADGPQIITNALGDRTTPSVVGIRKQDGALVVGTLALRQAVANPTGTISRIKSLMGQTLQTGAERITKVDYEVLPDPDGRAEVVLNGERKTPAEISALILAQLKKDAEDFLGEEVTKAVITVPAYFDDMQRTATREAGELAGLEVLRIINEPTAAALAYGFGDQDDKTILVFDLGGGTFDVSLLRIGDGVFQVQATAGDTNLGGDNYNDCIVDFVAEEFLATEGIDLRKDREAHQRLVEAAEKAKIELSSVREATINLPFITATQDGPKHIDTKITRDQFEQITQRLTDACRGPFDQVLADADITPEQIDEVILVGGSTRMPAIRNLVRDLSHGKEPHKGVNADEAVAAGAAIQGGVLMGDVKEVLLLDVTPLSLAIETKGGIATRLIDRNTRIPVKEVPMMFTTSEDNQPNVGVHIVQGESDIADSNRSLGRYEYPISLKPRGEVIVEVRLWVDANGIVGVRACEVDIEGNQLGQPLQETITPVTGRQKEEVDKILAEQKEHIEADAIKAAQIRAFNETERVVADTKRLLQEITTLTDEQRHDIVTAMREAERVLAANADTEALEAAFRGLDDAWVRSQEPEEAPSQPQHAAVGGDEELVERDIES